jgi:hypothetical protein
VEVSVAEKTTDGCVGYTHFKAYHMLQCGFGCIPPTCLVTQDACFFFLCMDKHDVCPKSVNGQCLTRKTLCKSQCELCDQFCDQTDTQSATNLMVNCPLKHWLEHTLKHLLEHTLERSLKHTLERSLKHTLERACYDC